MPKVLVSGRGGSGKSTVVSLLSREAGTMGRVLVVDADESNLGLASMLGVSPPQESIMDYLGGKPAVGKKLIARLKGEGNEAVRFFEDGLTLEDLPAQCVSAKGSLSLVRIGKIQHAMEGCACPMGAVARAFLNQLTLADSQWAFVDTEAGIEHFGRGVIEGVDAVLLVVDPSNEAVILSEKAADLCREAEKPFSVVLNKVDATTEDVLRNMLSAKHLQPLGVVPYSPGLVEAGLAGRILEEPSATAEISRILRALN